MRIAITVGHSVLRNGSITSADGKNFGGGNEYKFNKRLASKLAGRLRKKGHVVDVIICPEKRFIKSTEEKNYKLNIVNKGKYELVVELHLNASHNSFVNGCEVFYISAQGKLYAERVQKALATVFVDRGIKKSEKLYMLTRTKPVAILLETFFCTNKKEWKWARLHKGKIARLIADAI